MKLTSIFSWQVQWSDVNSTVTEYERDRRSLEVWLSEVETRIEEAQGDEDKLKVGQLL